MSRPDKRMLTVGEAAEYCGFKSARQFVAYVRVAPVNYGNSVRYDRQRLDEWLDTLSLAPNGGGLVDAAGDDGARH